MLTPIISQAVTSVGYGAYDFVYNTAKFEDNHYSALLNHLETLSSSRDLHHLSCLYSGSSFSLSNLQDKLRYEVASVNTSS